MIRLIRTTSDNPDFGKLVAQLDAYLAILDGDDHEFYAQFNKTSLMKNTIVAFENETAIGIGAYKEYDNNTVEIKRMYTLPKFRGKGIASKIIADLERWAKEENYTKAILETGNMQTEAISLYQNLGYTITENYGQYIGVLNSVCMKKNL